MSRPALLPRHPLTPVAQALLVVFLGATAGTGLLPAQAHAAEAGATVNFDIPAGSLDQALSRFGRQAGIQIAVNAELTSGRQSPGLSGKHGIADGLSRLLAGSGLEAVRDGSGEYTLRRLSAAGGSQSETTLPPVRVTASSNSVAQGATAGGFLSKATPTVGPWEGRSLQDAPYSISVMSSEQAGTTIARDFDQLYKMNPVIQTNSPTTVFGYPSVKIRGFDHDSSIVDGVRLSSYTYGLSTEETERVEVMNGLSGFLYGAGNVGGVANYVLKRPTYQRLANFTVGNYGAGQWFGHVDLGNRIDDEGKFAYRLNAVYSDGDTAKDDQQMKKWLISGALDFNVTDNLLLQFEAAHTYWHLDRVDSRFYSSGINYWPEAFDNKKTYTPGWTFNETESDRIGTNLRYSINDALTLRAAYLYKKDRREFNIIYPIYTSTGWTMYNPSKAAPYDTISQGAYTYLDAAFKTGNVSHKLTMGGSWDTYREEKHVNSYVNATTSSGASYPTPTNLTTEQLLNLPSPTFSSNYGPRYKASESTNKNLVIGDDIQFTDHWSALVGFNHASLETRSYSTNGQLSSRYENSALTPTVSLIYKPVQPLTTYASYMESLESGGVVPNDPNLYNNPGAILDAIISKQYEIGAKYVLASDLLLTSALFRIEKANTYNETGSNGKTTISQDGLQIHQGLELTLAGKLTERVNISAGGTLMDLGIEKATNPALEGKKPIGSSPVLAKLSLQYAVPGMDGLVLSGGAYYAGKKYKDSANQQEIDAYTIFDVGASYRTKLAGKFTVFNLYVSNVTNKDYWSSYWQLGLPRSIAFSVKSEF